MTTIATTVTAALTTTFSVPSDCTASPWGIWTNRQSAWIKLGGDSISSCWPSSFQRDPIKDGTVIVYSPGICPSGWTSACSSEIRFRSLVDTVVSCCPSAYNCVARNPAHDWEGAYGCVSPISTFVHSVWGAPEDVNMLLSYYQLPVMIMTADESSSTSSMTSASPGSTPTSLFTSTPLANTRGGGLSTGAKAGIGVGAVLGAAIVALLAYVAWRLHPKGTNAEQNALEHRDPPLSQYRTATNHPPELYGNALPLAEMAGTGTAYKPAYELKGS